MSLTNAYIPYKTIRDDIVSFLRTNYTTLNTDLHADGGTFKSASLKEQILPGDPVSMPIPDLTYPVILVKIVNKSEEFRNLGHAGRKIAEILFRVYGITMRLSGETDTEIMQLTKNIEGLFRDNINFSTSILYSSIGSVGFGVGNVGQGAYVDLVQIDLLCKVELK